MVLVSSRDVHTDHGLRVIRARRSEAELAEVVLCLLGESVESCFGRLFNGQLCHVSGVIWRTMEGRSDPRQSLG